MASRHRSRNAARSSRGSNTSDLLSATPSVANPARYAAPSAVVSEIRERTTRTPATSA